jgi:hypothetical protein
MSAPARVGSLLVVILIGIGAVIFVGGHDLFSDGHGFSNPFHDDPPPTGNQDVYELTVEFEPSPRLHLPLRPVTITIDGSQVAAKDRGPFPATHSPWKRTVRVPHLALLNLNAHDDERTPGPTQVKCTIRRLDDHSIVDTDTITGPGIATCINLHR